MHFELFCLACLAHASYLLISDGEAVVVDPQRDVDNHRTQARKCRPLAAFRHSPGPPQFNRNSPQITVIPFPRGVPEGSIDQGDSPDEGLDSIVRRIAVASGSI